ncbi:MAG TPA: hypothetical protein VGC09_07280 [Rhodopila sp.]
MITAKGAQEHPTNVATSACHVVDLHQYARYPTVHGPLASRRRLAEREALSVARRAGHG